MTANKSLVSTRPVACVTGGAKRIGNAIVQALHGAGFNVIIHYYTSQDEATMLADSLNHICPNSACCVAGDLQDVNYIEPLAHAIMASFGRLDVLVHNASRFYPTPFGTITTSDWQNLIHSNAQAPLFLSQALAAHLAKQQGCIISLLDIHANARPFVGYSVYNMAKAAHQMLVQSLALELAPQIRVNGVAPGVNILPSADSEQALASAVLATICDGIPLQRIGTPEDIAQAVLFLTQASYITGHVIAVDGGRSLTLAGQ